MINERAQLIDDLTKAELKGARDGFGEGLVLAGQKDPRVVALCADLSESTRVLEFQNTFPERFFEMGVSEQNMMGVATGLALSDKIPFVASYAVFSPGRSWDQLRVSVCYTNANVKIIGAHTGLNVGPDGASHQALEDLAITRVLPNLTVIAPADFEEAKKATLAASSLKGPVYIRFGRANSPAFTTKLSPFTIGKANLLREGKDLTIFACGPLVYEALMVAEDLRSRFEIEVINVHTIKPLDESTIIRSAKKTGRVVTLEDHQVIGGLGGAISELLSTKLPTKVTRLGMNDAFGESGPPAELYRKYKLDRGAIMEAVTKAFEHD